MNNNKKGQAAMEFLMTYGWAILAAIIAIGVLAYFGAFSPGRFVSNAAVLNSPFGISEYNIKTGAINLILIQSSGDRMEAASVTITGTGSSAGHDCTVALTVGSAALGAGNPWNTGAQADTASCTMNPALSAGSTYSGNIVVTYKKTAAGLDQTSSGTIRGTVSA